MNSASLSSRRSCTGCARLNRCEAPSPTRSAMRLRSPLPRSAVVGESQIVVAADARSSRRPRRFSAPAGSGEKATAAQAAALELAS